MDLECEAQRLFLDVLAVDVSGCLERAEIPHALLKGPSTAIWLYDPPRPYIDVDVLVPRSRLSKARRALEAAGLAYARAGGVGEEAQHSLLMLSPTGYEVDVHMSLPWMPPDGDKVWKVLAPHVEVLDLGIGKVPALDEPGRCLTLALHAVGSMPIGWPIEDLRRALKVAAPDSWRGAQELARALKVEDLFLAGLSLADGDSPHVVLSRRAHLYLTNPSDEALALQRFRDARWRDLPRLLWREIFPTRGFMRHADPHAKRQKGLTRLYVARWQRIAANLPSAVRALRRPSTPSRSAGDDGRTLRPNR